MENQTKKCSLKEHNESIANRYCRICNIFMCNKCESLHSKLFQDHSPINIPKNMKNIYTGFCMEEKHKLELEFFCKNHNMLCCAACISKIQKKEYGKHKDCEILIIEDIQQEKEKQFIQNYKLIEDFSEKNQDYINNLKKILDKINEDKETLKLKILQIFTKIRTELNKREDDLMTEVDNLYQDLFFKEDLINDNKRIQEQLKLMIEKGKKLIKEKNKVKLSELINDYISFEDIMSKIKDINEIIKKSENNNINISFYREEEKIDETLEKIRKFGNIEVYFLFKSSILKDEIPKHISILNWIQEKTKNNVVKLIE